MPCSMTTTGAEPLSQIRALKWVTWTSGMVRCSASGWTGGGKVALGRVVLYVHRGQVEAGPAVQGAGHLVDFLRSLEDHGVHAVWIEAAEVDLLY